MTFEDFLAQWNSGVNEISVKTSGSTGQPKEIKLPRSFMKESAIRTNEFFRITQNSRLHSCVAPDFIGGKMMAVRAATAGCRLSWETPSNQCLSELKATETIDLLAVVPSQMHHILDNLDNLPVIKAIIIGGAKIPPQLRERIADSPLNAFETYGMTETASHIALRKVEKGLVPFKTLGDIRVAKAADNRLSILLPGKQPIITNDIASCLSSTEFFIKGRIDNVINSGGKKINPEEVEEEISRIFDGPFLISCVADEKWGEKIIMIIERPAEERDDSKLLMQIKALLPSWMAPKEIIYVNALPRTANGKIMRIRPRSV